MTTIILSAFNVLNYPEGGGHFWVYMQYVQGFRQLGCDVYWLEKLQGRRNAAPDAQKVAKFAKRMERYGMGGKFILYENQDSERGGGRDYVGMSASEAEAIFRRADLFLNFHYRIDPALLGLFPRTALVNIDPAVLQSWMSAGQLKVPKHDMYFTIGERVGVPNGPSLPDCGIIWHPIRPPVSLEQWPMAPFGRRRVFTTVSSWWSYDWLTDENGVSYDNNKRVAFLQFLDLPRLTRQPLELALYFGESPQDMEDRKLLESYGWRVRHSLDVARTPEKYRIYVQESRGEFGCAKPAYVKYQTVWVSDRTLCYLASGRPVVIQDTGPSSFLPNGRGMFRFSTSQEAAAALEAINTDYERHCVAAREIAEAYFDSKQVARNILEIALSHQSPAAAARESASTALAS